MIADTAGQERAWSRIADLLDRQKPGARIPQARRELVSAPLRAHRELMTSAGVRSGRIGIFSVG
ncbi:hypothetical protein E6W39_38260 [Kitasatospora acidiphila]|uniref:Uncharacterized protein n=1 Tax=Kitasatospora acidiphila TaxID=2567942 RepID=A0A540WDK1_9ACTN|nr:hypothetical protein [Kitasatospora acidiphila]TQF06967.1 hypothetical protein E6W39_38260 [Kitasatospora acidiphila]